MKAIQKNKTITSLELLKKINELREKEYLEKAKAGTLTEAERKRGKFIKLRHNNFIKVIRDEFSEEITGLKIYLSEDRSSARETAMRVAAGGIAKKNLREQIQRHKRKRKRNVCIGT